MSADIEADVESSTPIWAAFGDLMSVLLGVFVLILVGVIGAQMQLSHGWTRKSASASSSRSGARRWNRRWRCRWPKAG